MALGLGRKIAVAFLFVVGLAGDDVDREPAAAQMIEGCDFARHQGRRDKTGAMRDQITEPLGALGRVQGDRKPSADDEE